MKKSLLILLAMFACSVAANAQVYGDVNGDGQVTAVDVTAVYNYLLNGDETYLATADVNSDGSITSVDITIIYNIILGGGEPVNPPAPVTEYTVNGVTFKMVEVEGGTFMMGVDQQVGYAYPAHEVTLSTYSIGQTEVTQELWVAVMGSNPSYFNEYGNADLHSNHASAEWEFAARGGNLTHGYEYAGSENVNDVAWWKETLPSSTLWTDGWGTQTVATKAPNELGIYDMSGNVEEWCYDWFATYSSTAEPLTNPTGPETGTQRAKRGGTCTNKYDYSMKVYYRQPQNPDARGNTRGFRLALDVE